VEIFCLKHRFTRFSNLKISALPDQIMHLHRLKASFIGQYGVDDKNFRAIEL